MKNIRRQCFIPLSTFILLFLAVTAAQAIETTRVPTGVLHLDEENAYPGYTLLQTNPVRLIDMEGRVVHQWSFPAMLGIRAAGDAQLTPQGTLLLGSRGTSPDPENPNPLLVPGQFWGGTHGRLTEFAWNGDVIWDITLADTDWVSHHTFHRTETGRTFVLIWDRHTRKEAIKRGRDPRTVNADDALGTDPRPGVYIGGLWPDTIMEIAYTGPNTYDVVWEWRGWDHICKDKWKRKDNSERKGKSERKGNSKSRTCLDINYHVPLPTDQTHRSSADYMHANAVDFLEAENLVVLNSRIFGEFYLIDYDSGDIVYRWGNPSAWDKTAEPPSYMNDGDTQLFGPHGANVVAHDGAAGTLNILLFDNGWLRPSGSYSRAVEVQVDLDDPDFYAEPVWTYQTVSTNSLNSPFVSYAQRLANGNTLITSGMENHIFEVAEMDGQPTVVWEYVIPFAGGDPCLNVDGVGGGFVFRAYRYDEDYAGLGDLDLGGGFFPDCE